jgi:flagellar biosynthesis chaperone FliJ
MTKEEIKVQLCDIMLTIEHVQRQFEQLSQYKQQLLQQLQELEKVGVVQEVAATEE